MWWMVPIAVLVVWAFCPRRARLAAYAVMVAAVVLCTAASHAYAYLAYAGEIEDRGLAAASVEWGLAAVGSGIVAIVAGVLDFIRWVRRHV